jgi:hypothetical protein
MKRTIRHIILTAASALLACQTNGEPEATSETHFLTQCSTDETCGDDLTCVCGVCTVVCSASSTCEPYSAEAACTPRESRPLAQACADFDVGGTCEVPCMSNENCESVGPGYYCDRGLCRKDDESCSGNSYITSDYVLLGDLFLADSGAVKANLEDILISVGSLPTGANLRDYSSGLIGAFGTSDDLFSQYDAAKADGPARVVILNAGGADVLLDCDTDAAELCPTLQTAADGMADLLTEMAVDGVEHVVLFYYPRPDDMSLEERFDLLEVEFSRLCAASTVPCHFVPLAPYFEENRADLLTSMGLLPTEAGAEITAGRLFEALKNECIVE